MNKAEQSPSEGFEDAVEKRYSTIIVRDCLLLFYSFGTFCSIMRFLKRV